MRGAGASSAARAVRQLSIAARTMPAAITRPQARAELMLPTLRARSPCPQTLTTVAFTGYQANAGHRAGAATRSVRTLQQCKRPRGQSSRSPWYIPLDTRPHARHCSRSTDGAIHAGPVPHIMTRHRIQLASRLGAPLIAAAWLMGGGVPAWGAVMTYNVNSTADLPNSTSSSKVCATATGVCTLRAAIQASNANAGTDTIVLPAGTYTLTITGRNENLAATGDLDITDPVNITGAGASSGCPSGQSCVFKSGGGIQTGAILANNVATLNLSRVVVTQNVSDDAGGGIANSDILSLTDVTVRNNTCAGTSCFGGGVFNKNGGTATLSRVTLSGNTATGGGGLGSDSDVNLTNVTISGNTADSGAGIQHDNGTATLVNVTISNNIAPQGGGAFFSLGDVTFKYTIFAHDPPSEACQNFSLNFTSGGHNIDVGTSCEPPCTLPTDCPTGTTCTNNLCQGTGDLINTDPGIAPLANNGGPTFTQALVAGSPALDKGGAACPPPTTDQRSLPRPGTTVAKCDVGAFEHQTADPFPTTTTTRTTTTSTTTTTTPTTTTTTRPPTTTTTTPSTTTTTTVPAAACGDVNGDGTVNIGDALITAQYDVGLRTCGLAPFSHPEVCDVNHDAGCNIGDALKMAQCDVGLISCTFTCTPAFSCP